MSEIPEHDPHPYLPPLPQNERGGEILIENFQNFTPLAAGPELQHADQMIQATPLERIIPSFADFKELIFKHDIPDFGKARVIKDADGNINRVVMLPPITTNTQKLIKECLGKAVV